MLSGYGTGSRDGTGESKQYKTLRGSLNIDRSSVVFSRNGVKYKNKSVASITFRGHTRKVAKYAENNDSSLIFHDMTKQEALDLACTFMEFALFLEQRGRAAEQLVSSTQSEPESARLIDTITKVLMSLPRNRGVVPLMEAIRLNWLAAAERLENLASTKWNEAFSAMRSRVGEWGQEAKWRRTCADALGRLLSIYAPYDGIISDERPTLKLIETGPE